MRGWDLALELDRGGRTPLAVQLARGIAERIRAGALGAGALLPSTRELAALLGVHRNTVVAAYAELGAEGWIRAVPGKATTVAPDVTQAAAAPTSIGRRTGRAAFPLPDPAPRPPSLALARPAGMLELLGGLPDPRLIPSLTLGRAIRRALRRPAVLGYGDPQGHPRLRAALAGMLGAARGMAVAPEEIVVTRGAQMALALVARALLRPGDAVAIERLGYPPAWQAMREAGLRLVPIPVDRDGIDVVHLEGMVGRGEVQAVYLTPHHQYPTTVTLSAGRRLQLLGLARRERLLLIEDDYDNEFHYEGRPVLPLAAAGSASVAYVGTLSKVLAPGLRVGFVAAPADAAERLTVHRFYLDRQGDLATEAALAELFEEGEIQRHVWRARRVYRARRDALVEALGAELAGALEVDVPAGGMALWARAEEGVQVEEWAQRALSTGVAVQAGGAFAHSGRRPSALRLGFARHDEGELREAVRRLASALPPRAARRGRGGRPGAR